VTWPTRRTYTAKNGVPHAILRFNNGFVELPLAWLEAAQRELELKATLQLDDVSAVDRLAYILLTEGY
jgi:hypothetical protein